MVYRFVTQLSRLAAGTYGQFFLCARHNVTLIAKIIDVLILHCFLLNQLKHKYVGCYVMNGLQHDRVRSTTGNAGVLLYR